MTLETILRTVLHAVAWSALVAFCGVVAGLGVRWMLHKLGHALAETGRRCGKWATMTLASVALVCGVVGDKNATNEPPNGVPAPTPMMTAARGAPETFPLHLGSAARGAPETCLLGPTNAPEMFPLFGNRKDGAMVALAAPGVFSVCAIG